MSNSSSSSRARALQLVTAELRSLDSIPVQQVDADALHEFLKVKGWSLIMDNFVALPGRDTPDLKEFLSRAELQADWPSRRDLEHYLTASNDIRTLYCV